MRMIEGLAIWLVGQHVAHAETRRARRAARRRRARMQEFLSTGR